MSSVATFELPADAYRRQARRLRATYSKSPIQLQQALRNLVDQADRETPIASQPKDDVKQFAAAVASSMDGPVLRYSARQRLIQQAATLGIRRFDANLLIAAVQHRLQSESNVLEFLPPVRSSDRMNWVLPACVVALLQTLICGGGYLLIHRLF